MLPSEKDLKQRVIPQPDHVAASGNGNSKDQGLYDMS